MVHIHHLFVEVPLSQYLRCPSWLTFRLPFADVHKCIYIYIHMQMSTPGVVACAAVSLVFGGIPQIAFLPGHSIATRAARNAGGHRGKVSQV